MKNRKNRVVAMVLAVILCLGLVPSALAAGPTFSDVPETYWGYADIEAVAEAGLMNGTGSGAFSPEMKVSVAQFLTLLGRLVFPETTVGANDTWYGPYVSACNNSGLLDGTQLVSTNNLDAEISRYDMAVILRAAAKQLGVAEKAAHNSEVTDYGEIPTKYAEAVLAVYGMGLIRGDQAGNFNGSNTMMRAEVATVIMRLVKAKPEGSSTTEPEKPSEPEKPDPVDPLEPEIIPMPDGEKMVSRVIRLRVVKAKRVIGRPVDTKYTPLPDVPIKLYYTPDGGKTAVLVAEFKSPSQDEYERSWGFNITFEAPESWSSAENYENGNGFYFSAEAVLDGQRLVTSDLRTDGRAYPDVKRLSPVDDPYIPTPSHDIELTPPNGEKAKFTFQGYVEWSSVTRDRLADFTVQLYLADGTLVAETVSRADGTFSMECEVDALDGGFDRTSKLYYYTASGYMNGVKYEYNAIDPNDGNLILESLVRLCAVDEVKAGPPQVPDCRILITPKYRVGG